MSIIEMPKPTFKKIPGFKTLKASKYCGYWFIVDCSEGHDIRNTIGGYFETYGLLCSYASANYTGRGWPADGENQHNQTIIPVESKTEGATLKGQEHLDTIDQLLDIIKEQIGKRNGKPLLDYGDVNDLAHAVALLNNLGDF